MKIFVNFITIIRLFGIALLLFVANKATATTFLIYVVALLSTDWIDGLLARKFRVQSLFGSVIDALADKIFNICLLIYLIFENRSFILVLIGELVIALTNVHSAVTGKKVDTNIFGKVKMWLLSFSIIFGYIDYFELASLGTLITVMIVITFVFQLIALSHYITSVKSQEKIERKKMEIHSFEDLKYYLFDTDYYLSR